MIQRRLEFERTLNDPEKLSKLLAQVMPKVCECLAKELAQIAPLYLAEMNRQVAVFFAEYVERAYWPEVLASGDEFFDVFDVIDG